MFEKLQKINRKPKVFEFYTSDLLWNDPFISARMLEAHLDPNTDAASYNKDLRGRAVDWICTHFDIDGSSSVCDFGCGPGLYTTRFAEKGASVTGVDLSERSIRYASDRAVENNLAINYVEQNYLYFSTGKTYDLVTMIYRDFGALSPKQRSTLLGIFRKILADDGAILLDVDSMADFEAAREITNYRFSSGSEFWSSKPHHIFQQSVKYESEKVMLEKYTIIEEDRMREVYNWRQFFSLESLTDLFLANGLVVTETFSSIDGKPLEDDSKFLAIVARVA